jgi:hypothetical protein
MGRVLPIESAAQWEGNQDEPANVSLIRLFVVCWLMEVLLRSVARLIITPELPRLDPPACLLAYLPAGLSTYLPTYEVHWYLTNGSTYLLATTAADRVSPPIY